MGLEHDFPVRESAVPRIHVPPHRLDEWKEVAQDEITRAISQRHSWYNAFKDRVRDGYEMIADRPNLKAFVRNKPNSPDKDILIRSKLDGVTLDDLVSGMYCETTYDVRCTYAHLYEGNMLDAGLLQLHEGRTEEDPLHFVGMRWIAFRSPAPAIVTSRDFLFFSYEGTAYDVDGNRVLFRFLRTMPMDDVSVDDSNVPPLVRGKISNLHLYRQNGPHVDAFSKAMHSNAGNMPSWIVTKTISFMFPGIANMETVCDARALVNLGMAKLNPQRLKHPGSGRFSNAANVSTIAALQASTSACSVCFHKFKMTRAKRRCQSCCREVCKRCTRKLHLFDEAKQLSETAIVALRFCLNCTRQARAETRESLASYTHQRSSLHRSRRSSSGSLSMISTGQPSMHQLQQPPQQHQLVVTRQQRSASDRELYHQAHPSVPSTPGQPQSYYYDDNDSDDGNSSYTSGGGYTNGMLTPHGANYQHQQHHSGMTPRTTALTPEQLQQLQQLQQTHQLNPQDHEEFLRLYGQYANAAARQKKLISIDQLARNRPYGPPPPPPAPPAPVPQYQVHPNAGTFRRHNSGGGKGWTHAAAVGIPQSPAVNGYQRGYVQSPESVPRHLLAPMPQPDLPTTSSSDMIPLTLHDHHNRQGYQPHHQSRSPPESAAASEDLEAIFRMRMMLFEDKPVETDTLSTASSTSSSAKRHMQRKALGNEHLVPQLVQRY